VFIVVYFDSVRKLLGTRSYKVRLPYSTGAEVHTASVPYMGTCQRCSCAVQLRVPEEVSTGVTSCPRHYQATVITVFVSISSRTLFDTPTPVSSYKFLLSHNQAKWL